MVNLLDAEIGLINENYHRLDEEFSWEDPMVKQLISIMNSLNCQRVNCKNIREFKSYINKNTGVFSSIRGMNSLLLAASLSSEKRNMQDCKYIIENYNRLKKVGIKETNYLPLLSYILTFNREDIDIDYKVNKAKELYLTLGKVKGIDFSLIGFLALKEGECLKIKDDFIKVLYVTRNIFGREDKGINRASVLLSLSDGEVMDKSNKFKKIYDAAENELIGFGREQMDLLSLLIDSDLNYNDIIEQSNSVLFSLKESNQFKEWKISKRITSIIALTLVTEYNIRKCNNKLVRNIFSNNMNIIKLTLEPNTINNLNLFSI